MNDPTIKEPTAPATAAGLSAGNTILIIFFGISTIWTCFSVGGLTAVYNFLNSIQGAPFLALVGLAASAGWRTFKRWRDQRVANVSHEALNTLTGATNNKELNERVKAVVDPGH